MEVGLRESDGGFQYITDRVSDHQFLGGTDAGRLWWADTGSSRANSSTYKGAMSYAWNSERSELILEYEGTRVGPGKPDVTVTMGFPEASCLTLSAVVTNTGKGAIKAFSIPGDLKIPSADVEDALLPMLPGVILDKSFFTDMKKYEGVYPGAMFADYVGLRTSGSVIAVYGGKSAILQPASLGFEPVGGKKGQTRLVHAYRTWIGEGQRWQAPPVKVHVGRDYPGTIAGYREYKGVNGFKAIKAKLGTKTGQFLSAPLYKLDMGQAGTTFVETEKAVVDKLTYPGILHPVAFWPVGFDRNYPDFIPPNPDMGTTRELADLADYSRKKGHLVIPYTNFSWWDSEGPWLGELTAEVPLGDMTVPDQKGKPMLEAYGENRGYVVDQHNAWVKGKISEQVAKLKETLGLDGLFEDQWGARVPPLVPREYAGTALDPSTSYFEGALGHVKDYAGYNLMTECGVDILAENEVGFNGSNLLWDLKGYKPDTAPHTTYYPMAGMLLRDKVLLYQHDLAPETFTQSKAMLRWNLAMGYNLSVNFNSPWAEVAGAFQKHALGLYGGSLVRSYVSPTPGLTITDFDGYKAYANWDGTASRVVEGCTLPGDGAMVKSGDGRMTAGIFTGYNGAALSKGDHYLLELRDTRAIRILQPRGNATPLSIRMPQGWKGAAVTARAKDGKVISKVASKVVNGMVVFTYEPQPKGKPAQYYGIEPV